MRSLYSLRGFNCALSLFLEGSLAVRSLYSLRGPSKSESGRRPFLLSFTDRNARFFFSFGSETFRSKLSNFFMISYHFFLQFSKMTTEFYCIEFFCVLATPLLMTSIYQCCGSGSESGSGSTGSTCFWASWIRIH